MGQQAKTINGTAYRQLRADILSGRLRPGERLKFATLTRGYGVSVSVLREALAKLSAERLVVAAPQQGFRVTPLSAEDLQDLTAVRCDIEGLAFRYSMERGDLAWESKVMATHHMLERTQMTVDGDPQLFGEPWAVAHSDFHLALFAGCGSPRLMELAISLRDSAELYRRWSRSIGDPDRDIAGEHRDLRDAALDRDVEAGVNLLQLHIDRTTRKLLDAVSSSS